MSTSATFGRIYSSTTSGTSSGSYVVPSGKIAMIDAEAIIGAPSNGRIQITIGSRVTRADNIDGLRVAAFGFANEGETISWTITGTGKYRIFVFEKLSPT